MISLKRLNGKEFILNADLIEQIESAPDTVITLVTGNNIIVLDSKDDVVEKIKNFRIKIGLERTSKVEDLLNRS